MKIISNDFYQNSITTNYNGPPEQRVFPDQDCIVYCPTDHIAEFFRLCEQYPDRKFVVVSANSDYGIAYQKLEPVENDLFKWIQMIDFTGAGYQDIHIPSRHNSGYCLINDAFSVKCYSYTKATFNRIPPNILTWFCCNANIADSRVVTLPFGVTSQGATHLQDMQRSQSKKNKLYVNFQNNTVERFNLKNALSTVDWTTVVKQPKSYAEYIEDVSMHQFVLCPPGNGLDSYRIWETLYAGSIPVVIDSVWARQLLSELPVIFVGNASQMNIDFFNQQYDNMDKNFEHDILSADFWLELINNSI